MNVTVVSRLAPSPTGFLHLGNAWSFLWSWLWAKSQGGSVVLRMEDIDPDRSRPEYAKAIENDLHWLGLSWDGPTLMQSSRHSNHLDVIATLDKGGHIYPCYCTRKELRSLAAAPHVDDMGAPYLGTCSNLSMAEREQKERKEGRRAALRVRCEHVKNIEFVDEICGLQKFDLQQCGGDFALRRSDGVIAYQLAVVVDDAKQGVTHILRGVDILSSTPRQIFLCNLLGFDVPHYAHVPLLLDEQGERLAKRHKSMTLGSLRENGVQAEQILGLLAYLAGLRDAISPVHLEQLMIDFSLDKCKAMQMQQDIVVDRNCINSLFI